MTSYAIVIERASDGGYGVWSPDLPGVVALGDTQAEAIDEMRRASRTATTTEPYWFGRQVSSRPLHGRLRSAAEIQQLLTKAL